MGQSGKSRSIAQTPEFSRFPDGDAFECSLFVTELGWFGVWGIDGKVTSLCFGHASSDEVRRAGERLETETRAAAAYMDRNWCPALRRRLELFASGASVDFSDVELRFPSQTEFQKRVIKALRRVKYGQTVTYGKLAAMAGFPSAARAVGTVMASNRVPIIVPCHRVVASGGKLGGFSAPRGVQLKQQLLDMEAQGLFVS